MVIFRAEVQLDWVIVILWLKTGWQQFLLRQRLWLRPVGSDQSEVKKQSDLKRESSTNRAFGTEIEQLN